MKNLLFFLFSICLVNGAFSQTEAVSPTYTFSIKKKIEPPILDFVVGSLQFKDADGNNAINANEQCSIEFQLQNTGTGDGLNLKALVKIVGTTSGITIAASTPIANCEKDKIVSYSIPISSNMNTVDGKIEIAIDIDEPNGFNPPIVNLEIDTKKFAAPEVAVVDHVVYSNNGTTTLELRNKFSLQLLVQNTGRGVAKNVTVRLPLPENLFWSSGDEITTLGNMEPGETRSIEFEFFLNAKFIGSSLILNADVSESYGKYASDWTHSFALNQPLAAEKMIVTSKKEDLVNHEVASLRSDVDKDIPYGLAPKSNRYALIIGNEDYSSKQPGLEREVNVDFAANDARVFAEYTEKVLGYPKENIHLFIDATKRTMTVEIQYLIKKAQAQGDAEILFYYSGHGLPDEASNSPYLIPVDVNGVQVQDGISMIDVYDQLADCGAKKCLVVLDACFSGGARNKELVAMKNIKRKTNIDNVPGNILVLASSSGAESSAVYMEKQHGYFTYFLLKNLKETKGNGTIENCMLEVTKNVRLKALDIYKDQTPNALPGLNIKESWKTLSW